LHNWGIAPGPKFPGGESGGEWFSKLANLVDGSPPLADAPQWMTSVGTGNEYALGNYHPENETWTTLVSRSNIDAGPDAQYMVGQFAGDRFMNIGWSMSGPPMMTDDYPLETMHGCGARFD
jgi:hypothetical protein